MTNKEKVELLAAELKRILYRVLDPNHPKSIICGCGESTQVKAAADERRKVKEVLADAKMLF